MAIDIQEEIPNYINGSPISITICDVRHGRPHRHSGALEILYCLEGSIDLVAGFQKIKLNKGDFFSVDCLDIHCISSPGKNITMLIHIDLQNVAEDWDELQYVFFDLDSQNLTDAQKTSVEEIDDILLALGLFYAKNEYPDKASLQKIADRMVSLLIDEFNWFMADRGEQNEKMSHLSRDRFKRLSTFCQKNYTKKITLSMLSKEEHLNENYISQFMKTTNFKSFMSMLNNIRCYYAENMLLSTDLPATEIGRECGFSDTKYFYSSFKKWWGCTPKQHREWYKNYTSQPFVCEDLTCGQFSEFIQEFILEHHLKCLNIKYKLY